MSLDKLLDRAPVPCLEISSTGRVKWANSEGIRYLKKSSLDQLKNRPLWDFVREVEKRACQRAFGPSSKSRAAYYTAFHTLKCDDGQYLPTEIHVGPSMAQRSQRTKLAILNDLSVAHLVDRGISTSDAFYLNRIGTLPIPVFRKKISTSEAPHTFSFVNTEFCAKCAKTKDFLLSGVSDFDLYPARHAQGYQMDDTWVARTRKSLEIVEEHKPSENQTVRHVHVIKIPILDGGQVVEILGIFWDASEPTRKAAIAQLLKEESDYRALLKSLVDEIPLFLYRKDTRLRITFATNLFCQLEGKTIDQIVGASDFELFDKDLADKYYADDVNVLHSGTILVKEEKHKGGGAETEMMVRVVKKPIFGPDGRIGGLQGIFWDISDKQRDREELQRNVEELRANRKQEKRYRERMVDLTAKLAATVAATAIPHDFKSLLALIIHSTERIERGLRDEPSSKFHDYLEDVEKIESMCHERIEEIDRLKAISDGRPVEKKDRLDVKKAIEELVVDEELEPGRMEIKVGPDLPLIACDERLLRIALRQVLVNAKNATPANEHVIVMVHSVNHKLCISIQDAGPGIRFEKMGELYFPAPSQKSGNTAMSNSGFGLGLIIAHRIVQLHDGHIIFPTHESGLTNNITIVLPSL